MENYPSFPRIELNEKFVCSIGRPIAFDNRYPPLELPPSDENTIYLTNTKSYSIYLVGTESEFHSMCNDREDVAQITFIGRATTIDGSFSLSNENLISLYLEVSLFSDLTLELDCPKLMKLTILNCKNLIMSERTRPRYVELFNTSGKINIPENIDPDLVRTYKRVSPFSTEWDTSDSFTVREKYKNIKMM